MSAPLPPSAVPTPTRRSRLRRLAPGVGAALLLLAVAGCDAATSDVAEQTPPRAETSPRTEPSPGGGTRTPRPAPAPDAPARITGNPGTQVRTTLAAAVTALPVAPERRTGYDRDLFVHWSDADRNGCDTRDEVLITQNRAPGARLAPGCAVVGGRWHSYYDQETTTNPSDFDIDHLVPLAEAWDSGAHGWSPQRREAFANDLGDRRALIAVSASSNRTKSDADPAQWMPAYKSCVYVSSWVAIKVRWGLSVDPVEQRTLTRYADGCGTRRLTVRLARLRGDAVADARPSDAGAMPAAPATPTRTPAPSPPAGSGAGAGAGGLDPRFDYCTSAIAAGYGPYVRGRDPEYDWYRDGDGDGTVCES
ncbi:DUF1524 domain-containing protein [Nocardioides sp. zg-DK7169]|uniref:GmrSD restriction endonuclease domain-containing protein n=1 Tax=Nocardioides sp. zg-DK7169 TaxID=2736600 RepID=UPI001553A536|nr:DUF1524 domain-containing protein [Nocardioides sp. zg-DK7169]